MKERSYNKQLLINMASAIIGFIVNLGINFLLTPFIVNSLGAAAYGFVGLATNIISYTQLITIALNSMASRFITIKYTNGDIDSANKYFSSVFFSNILLSGIITLAMTFCILFLELMFDIPADLVFDVKCLFAFLTLNTVLGLLTNVYSVATFVKNRVDLSSIQTLVSNIFRAIALFCCFSLLVPHIWYIGLVGTMVTAYISFTNFRFTKKLTHDLIINKSNCEMAKIIELISSGVWNLISQLGIIMGQGLDLVIANLFIGATAMGIFSISRQIPFVIISFCGFISGVFAPSLTQMYARGEINRLKNEINKSTRIIGFFVTIPLAFLFIFGDSFFQLWLPNQNATLLQTLSILCGMELMFSLPLEVLWNVFLITNKLKYSTIFMICNHLLTFLIVIISMYCVESEITKLIILASTRTILGIVRSLTFLPIYGAYCLDIGKKSFYAPMLRTSLVLAITCLVCSLIKPHININTWLFLFVTIIVVAIICSVLSFAIVFNRTDREFIKSKIRI